MPTVYRSFIADSRRWDGFPFREGDVVISTPSKSGTTWTQMLVGLLVFDGPDFPAPLNLLSPWVDCNLTPPAQVRDRLEAQTHRRFLKTHTPLDGLPLDPRVHHVVVGRDPRDVFVSMLHHDRNMDQEAAAAARAAAVGTDDVSSLPRPDVDPDDPEDVRRHFLDGDRGRNSTAVHLAHVAHHIADAWAHRRAPNVTLLHYADLQADPAGELARLGAALGYALTRAHAGELAAEAALDRMRSRADELAPEAATGNWKDPAEFFRGGRGGEWRQHFTDDELVRYDARVAELLPADAAAWLHAGRHGSGVDPAA